MENTDWRRCPNCGHAGPECFDEENAETLAWMPDLAPIDPTGDGEAVLVLCPHCQHEYDPRRAETLLEAEGAPADRATRRAPTA